MIGGAGREQVLQAAGRKVAGQVEPAADKLAAVVEDKAHQLRVAVEEHGDELGDALKQQVRLPCTSLQGGHAQS